MSAWGTRQSYPAVVGTIVLLSAFFTATALLRPLIPPPVPNPVVRQPGAFMANAANQRVQWRTLDSQPFAEAKRLDRPVVLVVGSAWSHVGRYFDNAVLSDTEVAERLNREFVPVRIDASMNPEWSCGPFPFGMVGQHVDQGWYIAVFQPDGRPLGWMGQTEAQVKFDAKSIHKLLAGSLKSLDSNSRRGDSDLVATSINEGRFLLGESSAATGDLSQYSSSLLTQLDAPNGLTEGSLNKLFPWEWRFLSCAGYRLEAQKGLRSLATSNAVDWLDGGFYRIYGPNNVRYDKVFVENADLVAAMAAVSTKTGDSFLRLLAGRTISALLRSAVRSDMIYGWSSIEPNALDRSPRSSIRPSLIGRRFSSEDQKFITKYLGIDYRKDSCMLPHVVDPNDYVQRPDTYQTLFNHWQQLTTDEQPKFGGEGMAETTCMLYARLTEANRLLGNPPDQTTQALFPSVLSLRVGPEDVLHLSTASVQSVPYLGDYTSFSDACLQRFLATGDASALEAGKTVLTRAIKAFATSKGTVVGSVSTDRVVREAPWIQWPNLIDSARGSVEGELVRVLQGYSNVYRDTELGLSFRQSALSQVGQYASATSKTNLRLGSLAFGMSQVLSDRYVVVVGPRALENSRSLGTINPDILVFPAIGTVRRDFQNMGPGAYLVTQGQVKGPLGIAEAKSALGATP